MADGNTYKEALINIEEIAKEWIETAQSLRREVTQPKRKLVYA